MIRQDWLAPWLNQRIVKFRNDSDEDVPAYGVMRVIDCELVDDVQALYVIEKPSSEEFCTLYLVNGPVSVKAGDKGDGTWLTAGGTVKYSSGTPAYGEEWGPTDDDWGIVKNRHGFLMQGAPLDTTLKHAAAVQREVTMVFGKTDDAILKGETGTVSIWCGAAGSEEDTGWDIEAASNRFVTTLGDDKYVMCWKSHGVWYVAGEC